MVTDSWMHEFGVILWNLTQLIGAVTAAYYAWKSSKGVKEVAKQTVEQNATIARIDEKTSTAVDVVKDVSDKTDAQTEKIDTLSQKTLDIHDNTNGRMTELRKALEDSHNAQIDAFKSTQQQILDAWMKQNGMAAEVGGRRAGDKK